MKNNTEINNSHQSNTSLNHLNAQQNTKVLKITNKKNQINKNTTIVNNSEPLINDVQEPRHSNYTKKKIRILQTTNISID